MKCKYCGGKVGFFADFCPSCGKKTIEDTKRECPKCGKKIDENSKYCPKCGTYTHWDYIDMNIGNRTED